MLLFKVKAPCICMFALLPPPRRRGRRSRQLMSGGGPPAGAQQNRVGAWVGLEGMKTE